MLRILRHSTNVDGKMPDMHAGGSVLIDDLAEAICEDANDIRSLGYSNRNRGSDALRFVMFKGRKCAAPRGK